MSFANQPLANQPFADTSASLQPGNPPGPPGILLSVDLQHRIGALALDVQFDLTKPWTVLFGPSGSGKTTILRAIAGFDKPRSGRIALGGPNPQLLFDSAAKICLPPHIRQVRMAAQKTWLFPGSVRRNLIHGVQARTGERRAWIHEVLTRFQLQALAAANVDNLSGGERQRVALARLYASTFSQAGIKPLLLLDEPFTGMDAALRDTLATELRAMFAEQNIPVLSVTHDIGEAFLLADEVIKISAGRLTTQGPPAKVLAEERTRLLTQLSP